MFRGGVAHPFTQHRRVVDGKIYATLDDMVAAVVAHLEWLEADPERVRSLTNWRWIAATLRALPTEIAA